MGVFEEEADPETGDFVRVAVEVALVDKLGGGSLAGGELSSGVEIHGSGCT